MLPYEGKSCHFVLSFSIATPENQSRTSLYPALFPHHPRFIVHFTSFPSVVSSTFTLLLTHVSSLRQGPPPGRVNSNHRSHEIEKLSLLTLQDREAQYNMTQSVSAHQNGNLVTSNRQEHLQDNQEPRLLNLPRELRDEVCSETLHPLIASAKTPADL